MSSVNRTSEPDGDEGALVNICGAIFQALKVVTPLSLLSATLFRGRSKTFRSNVVDIWIVFNFFVSIAAAIAAALNTDLPNWLPLGLGIYAAYRLYDIIVIQVNVLLFDPYFHQKKFLKGEVDKPYALRGRYRLVLALLANFFEIGFWYSAAYLFLQRLGQLSIEGVDATGLSVLPLVFQQSIRALVTFDVSAFAVDQGTPAYGLVILQSFVGMFMTIVMLARVVSLLPAPRADSDATR